MTIGTNIRMHRARLDWSQERLAETAGLTAPTIAALEHDEANPRLETLQSVALALGVSVQSLFDDPAPTHPNGGAGKANGASAIHDATDTSGSNAETDMKATRQRGSGE